jgi:adenylate kinase family enzyme
VRISRVWITGSSGVGKSTLARQIAAGWGLPHLELDSLFHGPNWAQAEPAEFRAAVQREIDRSAWVVDGNYSVLGAMIPDRAELRIALDLPTSVTMARLVRRTARRIVTREVLWNGNQEQLGNLLRWDPDRNLIRWAWQRRYRYHQGAVDAENSWRAGGLPCVRLSSPGQVRRFVDYLRSRIGQPTGADLRTIRISRIPSESVRSAPSGMKPWLT